MTSSVLAVVLATMLSLVGSACAPRASHTSSTKWPSVDVGDEKAYPMSRYGGLQHKLRVASSDGRTLRVRGKVHNPYPDSVTGVRVVVDVLTSGASHGRRLERQIIDFEDIDLAGGAETVVSRDTQTMYTSNKFIRLAVFAIRRSGADVLPPPEDLGDAQVTQVSAAGAPIPSSMVGNIFSGF